MKITIRPNNLNIRRAYQDKLDEREIWHKLVVKIISWKDGLLEGGTVKFADKITSKEWATYSKRTIKVNNTYTRQRIVNNLNETKERIKKYGGFEEEELSKNTH